MVSGGTGPLKGLCKGDVWDTLGTHGEESSSRIHLISLFYYLDELETPGRLVGHLPALEFPDFKCISPVTKHCFLHSGFSFHLDFLTSHSTERRKRQPMMGLEGTLYTIRSGCASLPCPTVGRGRDIGNGLEGRRMKDYFEVGEICCNISLGQSLSCRW